MPKIEEETGEGKLVNRYEFLIGLNNYLRTERVTALDADEASRYFERVFMDPMGIKDDLSLDQLKELQSRLKESNKKNAMNKIVWFEEYVNHILDNLK